MRSKTVRCRNNRNYRLNRSCASSNSRCRFFFIYNLFISSSPNVQCRTQFRSLVIETNNKKKKKEKIGKKKSDILGQYSMICKFFFFCGSLDAKTRKLYRGTIYLQSLKYMYKFASFG